LVSYLYKKESNISIKEYKVQINNDKYEKLWFPEIYNTTLKEVIIKLVIKFKWVIKDYNFFITRPIGETIE